MVLIEKIAAPRFMCNIFGAVCVSVCDLYFVQPPARGQSRGRKYRHRRWYLFVWMLLTLWSVILSFESNVCLWRLASPNLLYYGTILVKFSRLSTVGLEKAGSWVNGKTGEKRCMIVIRCQWVCFLVIYPLHSRAHCVYISVLLFYRVFVIILMLFLIFLIFS